MGFLDFNSYSVERAACIHRTDVAEDKFGPLEVAWPGKLMFV